MWTFLKKAKAFVFKALGREGKPTGKPQKLTPKAQERLSTANLDRHVERLVALTKRLSSGKIDVARWQEGVKADLRQAYIQNYLLGIGGKGQLTKRDYGRVGAMLKNQYKFLARFADGITDRTVSAPQALMRIQMYARSARGAYEKGRQRTWEDAKQSRWLVNHALENCEDCLKFEAMGWRNPKDFSTLPGLCQTKCKANCGCRMEYR